MSWQIQMCAKAGGTQWEPVSVERRDEKGERRYHYDTLEEARGVLDLFLKDLFLKDKLRLLSESAREHKKRLLDSYDVRFIEIGRIVHHNL